MLDITYLYIFLLIFKYKLIILLVMRRQITLIELPRPKGQDVNYELQWLGTSLGLFGDRDRDRSCFRVFVTLVKDAGRSEPLSSDQIATQLRLSRGTVIHHINRLQASGIVVHEKGGYVLRVESLQRLIDELHRDTEQLFEHLKQVSKEVDGWLGL